MSEEEAAWLDEQMAVQMDTLKMEAPAPPPMCREGKSAATSALPHGASARFAPSMQTGRLDNAAAPPPAGGAGGAGGAGRGDDEPGDYGTMRVWLARWLHAALQPDTLSERGAEESPGQQAGRRAGGGGGEATGAARVAAAALRRQFSARLAQLSPHALLRNAQGPRVHKMPHLARDAKPTQGYSGLDRRLQGLCPMATRHLAQPSLPPVQPVNSM